MKEQLNQTGIRRDEASLPAAGGERERAGFRFGPRDHLVNLAFWTVFAAITAVNLLSNDFEPVGVRRAVPETTYWFLHSYVWAAVTPIVFWLVWRFGSLASFRVRNGGILLAAGLALTAVADLVQRWLWGLLMGPPVAALAGVDHGWIGGWLRLDDEAITCAAIFLAGFLREQLARARWREQEASRLRAGTARLQAQLAQARLDALRSQLDPHFLFNSLNALSALMDEDPRSAQRMLARLSELLRLALEARDEGEVPLHEEMALTERYLEILEIRFQGRLETRIDVGPEARDALVPNLLLQPLVENAMKHGVGPAGGRGRIEVRAWREGEWLRLTVHDSGDGAGEGAAPRIEPDGDGRGVGLRNTRARLRELYGPDQELRLHREPGGGVTARIMLPFRVADEAPGATGQAREEEARV